jgi:MFS family permease
MTTAPPTASLRGTLPTVVLASTVGALPALLLGGLAVLVREDLGFGEFRLGVAVAAFFTASIVISVPVGLLSERIGPVRTMRSGISLSVLALVGVAVLAQSWLLLVVLVTLGGVGNTLIQVGANHLLATDIGAARQGLAYGIKQSAIPLAGILAGLALPVIGLTVGWRWAYLAGAVLAALVLARVWGLRGGPQTRGGGRAGDAPLTALVVVALGAGLGTAAGNALTAFTVEASVAHGIATAAAGLLLTAGSLTGILVRVISGHIADRMGRRSLLLAASLLSVGAIGYAMLALTQVPGMIVLGTLIAFGGGWGYQGLVLLAVARTNPNAPGAAMAVLRLGPSSGAALGPVVFGALIEQVGYGPAWGTTGFAAVLGVILLLLGRRMLLARPSARARALPA